MINKIRDNMRTKIKKVIKNTRPRHIVTIFLFFLALTILVTYYKGRADELFPDYIRNVHIQNMYGAPENIVSAGEYIKVVFDLKEDVREVAMVNKILGTNAYTSCDNSNLKGNGFKDCYAYIAYDIDMAKVNTSPRATFSLGLETFDELSNPLSIFVDKTSDDSYVDFDKPTTAYYYELGDVNISSNNTNDKTLGKVGDTVTLNFATNRNLASLSLKILDKDVSPVCYDTSPVTYHKNYFKNIFSYLFLTKAEAAISYPIKCTANITLLQEDIDKYKSSNVNFEINFSTQNTISDQQLEQNYIVNTTNDSSFVQIKNIISPIKDYSNYVSSIHIESNNISSSTIATLNDKVILTYELDSSRKYEKNIVKILDKEVRPICQMAKAAPQEASVSNQAVVVKNLDKVSSADLAKRTSEISTISSGSQVKEVATVNSASQEVDTIKADLPKSFTIKCTATIEVTQADINPIESDTVIPFTVNIKVSDRTEKPLNFEIKETDDQSFVKLLAKTLIKADSNSNQSAESENATPVAVSVPAEVSNITPGAVIMNPNSVKVSEPIVKQIKEISLNKVCPIIAPNRFYRVGSKVKDILIIKREINQDLGTNMKLTEIFDKELEINLKKWQDKHADIVLIPWGEDSATGYFYKTSNWAMNYLGGCTIPKYVLEKYKKQ